MIRRLIAILFSLLVLTANVAVGSGGCSVAAANGHPMHSQASHGADHGRSHNCPTRSHTPASCSTMITCSDQAVAVAEPGTSTLSLIGRGVPAGASPTLASIILPPASPPPRA